MSSSGCTPYCVLCLNSLKTFGGVNFDSVYFMFPMWMTRLGNNDLNIMKVRTQIHTFARKRSLGKASTHIFEE